MISTSPNIKLLGFNKDPGKVLKSFQTFDIRIHSSMMQARDRGASPRHLWGIDELDSGIPHFSPLLES